MITTTITSNQRSSEILLGRSGENGARTIIFDLSAYVLYGVGTALLLHRRNGDTQAYVVASTQDDDAATLTWAITNADTANSGTGDLELDYYVDGTIVKSKIYKTIVLDSMYIAETPDVPDGVIARIAAKTESSIAEIEAASDAALAAIQELVDEVKTYGASVSDLATVAEQSATNAAKSAESAATSEASANSSASSATESATEAARLVQEATEILESMQIQNTV